MAPPDEDEEELLARVRELVDDVAQQICEDHYDAPTQEPPTTARLAQAIEMAVQRHPINVNGLVLEVATQDVPDRSSTMERRIGGDLYISLVRRDKRPPANKGMLVQAKWDYRLANDPLLHEQASRLTRRTRDSYIWAYGRHTIASIPAGAFAGTAPIGPPMTAGQLVADALGCNKGDPGLGRNLELPRAEAMTEMLNRLHAEASLEFEVSEQRTTSRRRSRAR